MRRGKSGAVAAAAAANRWSGPLEGGSARPERSDDPQGVCGHVELGLLRQLTGPQELRDLLEGRLRRELRRVAPTVREAVRLDASHRRRERDVDAPDASRTLPGPAATREGVDLGGIEAARVPVVGKGSPEDASAHVRVDGGEAHAKAKRRLLGREEVACHPRVL
jgi:hypothetical protein